MSRYRLDVTRQVVRQLRSLPQRLSREIGEAIVDLADDPHPPNSAPLSRELRRRYRLKINGWRVIYMVEEQDRVVIVLALRPRDEQTYLNIP